MQGEQKDIKRRFRRKSVQSGLVTVVLAALLLEAIAAIQYRYTRGMMERNLEQQVLIMLRASAMRMDGNLNSTVGQAMNQVWHAQRHLDDPGYMETMVSSMVENGGSKVVGVAVSLTPGFYPQKGRWYEPYAHRQGDSVVVEQIGSAQHDYTQLELFQTCMRGDTMKWSTPYLDADGAKSIVTTYALPLRDGKGKPVATLGIDITTDWISETMSDIRLHPSSFSLALKEEGGVIAAPVGTLCSQELADRIAAMVVDPTVKKEDKADGRVTCFYFSDEHQRKGRVYYARKKYEPHWVLAKVVYDDEAFGELATMRRNIFWATLAGLLVLSLIIYIFARNGKKLRQSLMQQERTDREMQIGNGIQQALLPQDEPSLRGVGEVQVEGRLIPAREVGGDLYNVFLRDGKLFFCIGDVSGKGVPAALIMAVAQTLFHSIASKEDNPASIVQRINVTACRNNKSNMFVTLFVGVLDLKTGVLDYCNAGHERPLIDAQPLDTKPNMPVGLFDDFVYEKQQTTIAAGQTIFLYTDGLTEARNAQGKLFGRENVVQLLTGRHGMAPKELIDDIIGDVKRYAGHTEQSDDLTLLAIRYNA